MSGAPPATSVSARGYSCEEPRERGICGWIGAVGRFDVADMGGEAVSVPPSPTREEMWLVMVYLLSHRDLFDLFLATARLEAAEGG